MRNEPVFEYQAKPLISHLLINDAGSRPGLGVTSAVINCIEVNGMSSQDGSRPSRGFSLVFCFTQKHSEKPSIVEIKHTLNSPGAENTLYFSALQ